MRLINTKTLELEEFFDIDVPSYAILSHTWSSGEVSLQAWADREGRRLKPGYQKIISVCAEAAKDGFDHVWVDTNCIDKTSSAELSEAINSMFAWYKKSQICYAYLEDVPFATLEECVQRDSAFRNARWFTRGWTLQELLAPRQVKFFSKDWKAIGTKSDLAICISEITGIACAVLLKYKLSKSDPLRGYSVAQRLSWASRRSTTRIEDQSYSLLGLFNIAMPLVYGEGHKAFTRLIEEIIRRHADHSVFASQLRYVDLLPRSPRDFGDTRHVVMADSPQLQKHYTPVVHSYPFQLTNTGLQITLPIVATLVPHFVFGALDCWSFESGSNRGAKSISRIWIPLLQTGPPELRQYLRLVWPQVCFSVRLTRKFDMMQSTSQSYNHSDTAEAEQASILYVANHLDLVSTDLHKSIHIKKSYIPVISVPEWQPREAASPFLLCFPRGTADYRLFNIYPTQSDTGWSAQEPPTLPLVMAQRIILKGSASDEGNASDPDVQQQFVYGAVVVFKKRESLPPKFVAICLANVLQSNEEGQAFSPVCKILTSWTPLRPQHMQDINFDVFSSLDASEDALVTTQQVREPRPLGLTQVVFDRTQMMEEMQLSHKAQDKAPEGILHHFGRDYSDDESASFQDYMDVTAKKAWLTGNDDWDS
ncbi:Vegetative incompatibility protein HET-E-1 [Cladobotryum mycophilum]|uniref:Vegetative incompatibility protein HET-E-1 n=1 Tax=Cladobotryum mycophilum TaxID=491253 RepID=A0ABR0S8H5_9HYPO